MKLKATPNPVLAFGAFHTSGKISFNDGLTFNFIRTYDQIRLYRSRKFKKTPFRSQNHEIAANRYLDFM